MDDIKQPSTPMKSLHLPQEIFQAFPHKNSGSESHDSIRANHNVPQNTPYYQDYEDYKYHGRFVLWERGRFVN
jgi:hypothetical protein